MKSFIAFLRNNKVYLIFLLVFSIIAFEIILRVGGHNETYSESIGQEYQNYFNRVSNNYYQTWKANDTFTLDHKDFKFFYQTNELGVREISSDSFLKKSKNSYRIITLGDSFTEGVGAPYDSSYPRLLENYLQQRDTGIYVFNAGSSGSDPFFSYALYRNKLKKINASLIIVTINFSDIDDFFYRGGMERFRDNGTVVNRSGPWFEPLYGYSFIIRFIVVDIFGMKPQLLVSQSKYEAMMEDFKEKAIALFKNFKATLPQNCKLLVVVFPPPSAAVYKNESTNIKAQKILNDILAELSAADIDTLNLFPHFEAIINDYNLHEFTYENDGHFNPKGYHYFASFVLAKADSLLKTTAPLPQ